MSETDPSAYERGAAKLREVYAGDVVDLPEGTMAFNDVMMKSLFAEVWDRERTTIRDRRLLIMGVIAASGGRRRLEDPGQGGAEAGGAHARRAPARRSSCWRRTPAIRTSPRSSCRPRKPSTSPTDRAQANSGRLRKYSRDSGLANATVFFTARPCTTSRTVSSLILPRGFAAGREPPRCVPGRGGAMHPPDPLPGSRRRQTLGELWPRRLAPRTARSGCPPSQPLTDQRDTRAPRDMRRPAGRSPRSRSVRHRD